MVGLAQADLECIAEQGIVFDQQNAHQDWVPCFLQPVIMARTRF
jgi:hypothetical protein